MTHDQIVIYPSLEELLSHRWRSWVVQPLEWVSSVLSLLFLVLLLIITIPIGYLHAWRHTDHPKSAWNLMFHRLVTVYFFLAGITVEVEGLEFLPNQIQPIVLAANHPSHLDGLALSIAIEERRAAAMTAPNQFFPWPFSFWFRQMGSIDVARNPAEKKKYTRALSGKKALMLAIWKLTTLKKSIVIFPEGHIERIHHPLPYKTGAVRMAIQAGVPLHPVTIRGSERVFSPNRWLLRPGTIRIIFHPALPLPSDTHAVADYKLIDILTSQLLCRIAADLAPNYYTPGMIGACRDILALHPVTRAASGHYPMESESAART